MYLFIKNILKLIMEEMFGSYRIISEAGDGGFGRVYLVEREGDEEKVGYSLKTLIENDEKELTRNDIESFHKEIHILKKLSDESEGNNYLYIPKLYEWREYTEENKKDKIIEKENMDEEIILNDTNRPFYVIDFFSRSCLHNYITKEKLSEKHAKIIFKRIIEGIKFCHDKKICHLDIKCDNIMFDKEFNPIIIDFGFSEILENESDKVQGVRGYKSYRSPEMWKKDEFDGKKSDIFSLGVVLFNLVAGHYGFVTSQENDKYYKHIRNENYKAYWKKFEDYEFSEDFKELYQSMIAYDPEKRPSLDQILGSNWLKEAISENDKKELKEKLNTLFKKLKNENEEIGLANDIIDEEGYATRGLDDNENNQSYFDENLEPKKISNDRITINHFIKINGTLNEVKFMNRLTQQIASDFKDKCFIEASKNNLKFKLIFEYEDDEEHGNCTMDIELFKYEKGGYLVEFLRRGGIISDYNYHFSEIKKIIKNKLI